MVCSGILDQVCGISGHLAIRRIADQLRGPMVRLQSRWSTFGGGCGDWRIRVESFHDVGLAVMVRCRRPGGIIACAAQEEACVGEWAECEARIYGCNGRCASPMCNLVLVKQGV